MCSPFPDQFYIHIFYILYFIFYILYFYISQDYLCAPHFLISWGQTVKPPATSARPKVKERDLQKAKRFPKQILKYWPTNP